MATGSLSSLVAGSGPVAEISQAGGSCRQPRRVPATAMARAVKVTDGVLEEGTVPNAVTTACRRQMASGDGEKGSVLGNSWR
jgi:hypothetical protein